MDKISVVGGTIVKSLGVFGTILFGTLTVIFVAMGGFPWRVIIPLLISIAMWGAGHFIKKAGARA